MRLATARLLVCAWLALAYGAVSQAAPPPRFDAHRPPAAQPAAEAVGVDGARLRRFTLQGPRQHPYLIQVAALGPEPACGYPVLYLLDGNAAMAALLAANPAAPVGGSVLLVAVGYATDARFDTSARARDYTPPAPDGGPVSDPRGRAAGGADAFLDFLADQLLPRIAARWPVNAGQRGIEGHSYGGLLVLRALFTRPGLFTFHAAASPSLWWQSGQMQNAAEAWAAQPSHPAARLLLMRGTDEQRRGHKSSRRGGARAFTQLARTLGSVDTLTPTQRQFAGLGHGAMFSAALGPAIRAFAAQAACASPASSASK